MTEELKAKDVVLIVGFYLTLGFFPVPGLIGLVALCVAGAIINKDNPPKP
jgi:hypothetical protein